MGFMRRLQSNRFDVGTQVGEVARHQYPGGTLVESLDLSVALAQTREWLSARPVKPLFEGAIEHDGVLIRVDILLPEGQGLELYEIKSSTAVKEYHLPDIAVQFWVMKQAGYPVEKACLSHINNSFVYSTKDEYEGLFSHVDLTGEAASLMDQVPDWIGRCREALTGDEPVREVGDHCQNPFECPFFGYCDQSKPVDFPVESLPRGGKKAARLIDQGIHDIRDIPEGILTKDKHLRVWEVVRAGRPFLDPEAGQILAALPFPRYYIDFETISMAVPLWLGTCPYQRLPFQWSCHVEHENGELEHFGFLDVSGDAPMRGFTESLVNTLGDTGPVLVYNAGFENSVMRELAKHFPEFADRLNHIISRVVDLLVIARDHYYHPDMHGSWSIKQVLPTIAPELDYQNLVEVHDGGEAQTAYLECISQDTSSTRREMLRRALEKYCALDTLAMVKISMFFQDIRS